MSGCFYDVQQSQTIPSVIGSGRSNTVIYMTPNPSSCTVAAKAIGARGFGARFSDFTIDGGGSVIGTADSMIQINQAYQPVIENVSVLNWGSTQSASRALLVLASADISLRNVLVQGSSSNDRSVACEISGNGSALNTFCSNHYHNLIISNNNGHTPLGQTFSWIGGGADECGDAQRWCTQISDNSEFIAQNSTFFSTIKLGNNAIFYATNINAGIYNSGVRGIAIEIPATSVVKSVGSTWRGNGGAASVVNFGEFDDGLMNQFPTCTGGTCTVRTAAQAFIGNLPVRR